MPSSRPPRRTNRYHLNLQRLEDRITPSGPGGGGGGGGFPVFAIPLPDYGTFNNHEQEDSSVHLVESGTLTSGPFDDAGTYNYGLDVTGSGSQGGSSFTYEAHTTSWYSLHVDGSYDNGAFTVADYAGQGAVAGWAEAHFVNSDGSTADYSDSFSTSYVLTAPPDPLSLGIFWPNLGENTDQFTLDDSLATHYLGTWTTVDSTLTAQELDWQSQANQLLHEEGSDSYTDSDDLGYYWGDRAFTQDTSTGYTYHRHDSFGGHSDLTTDNSVDVVYSEVDRDHSTGENGSYFNGTMNSGDHENQTDTLNATTTNGIGSYTRHSIYTSTSTGTDDTDDLTADVETGNTMTDLTHTTTSDATAEQLTYDEAGTVAADSGYLEISFALDDNSTHDFSGSQTEEHHSSSDDGSYSSDDSGTSSDSEHEDATIYESGDATSWTFSAQGTATGSHHDHTEGTGTIGSGADASQFSSINDNQGQIELSISDAGSVNDGMVTFDSHSYTGDGSWLATYHGVWSDSDQTMTEDETLTQTISLSMAYSDPSWVLTETDGSSDSYTSHTTFTDGSPPLDDSSFIGNSTTTSTPVALDADHALQPVAPLESLPAPALPAGLGEGWAGSGLPPLLILAQEPPSPFELPAQIFEAAHTLYEGYHTLKKGQETLLHNYIIWSIRESATKHGGRYQKQGCFRGDAALEPGSLGISVTMRKKALEDILKDHGFQNISVEPAIFVKWTVQESYRPSGPGGSISCSSSGWW